MEDSSYTEGISSRNTEHRGDGSCLTGAMYCGNAAETHAAHGYVLLGSLAWSGYSPRQACSLNKYILSSCMRKSHGLRGQRLILSLLSFPKRRHIQLSDIGIHLIDAGKKATSKILTCSVLSALDLHSPKEYQTVDYRTKGCKPSRSENRSRLWSRLLE